MNEFTFKITKHIGTISRSEIGWNKEVNLVSWNGKEPKLDIRDWDARHERMSRGVMLTKAEAQQLLKVMLEEAGLLELQDIIEYAVHYERKYGIFKEGGNDSEEI